MVAEKVRGRSGRGVHRPGANVRWPPAVLAAVDAISQVGGMDRTLFFNAAAAYLLENPEIREAALAALGRWTNDPPVDSAQDATDWARTFCGRMFAEPGQRPASRVLRQKARKAAK